MKDMISRRDFLKLAGAGTLAATVGSACSDKNNHTDSESAALGEIPTDKMTYRTTPSSGDKVSILGYGCMRWPTRKREDGKGDEVDQEAVNELVDYALAHGVNYFDTAPVYVQGMSERATSNALKRHPRESYYIATKLSNFSNSSRENSIAMYENSFKELQTDYIDYYLLHSVGGNMRDFNRRFVENGMLDFLQKEREAGRIRHLGWSFHGNQRVFDEILAMDVKWDFVQIQMNYVDWLPYDKGGQNAKYIYDELAKRNIPAVIMEPLLGGRLARMNDHLVGMLKAQRPTQSIASWAFRFCGTYPGVLTALSGMTYMEHLQDNIRTYAPLEPCSDEELALLENVAEEILRLPLIPCNDCKYCMPCPYGIDIPAVLLHYNKCINEGNVPESSGDPNYREARRAFLVGYDRSVPKLRQASYCTGCNECTSHCPQRIRIPRKLQEIDKYVEQLKQETL